MTMNTVQEEAVTKKKCKKIPYLVTFIVMFIFLSSITGCFNDDSPEKGARLWVNAALNSDVQVFGQRTTSNIWDHTEQEVMHSHPFGVTTMKFDLFVKGIRSFDDALQFDRAVDSDRYVYKLDALTYNIQEDGETLLVTVSGKAYVYDENEQENLGESSLFPLQMTMVKEEGVWKCNSWVWRPLTGN